MMTYEEFRREVQRRKEACWVEMLLSEPKGRPAGRRPRDPEKEALLAELDRRRVAESELLRTARRVPAEGC